METLHCDIRLNGSTSKFIEWHLLNSNTTQFVTVIKEALIKKAKTRPALYATRCTSLMGIIYDKFEGDAYLLDVLITAIHQANKVLTKNPGRGRTTGCFKTRKELVDKVLFLYKNTSSSLNRIATHCEVSNTTVANIIEYKK